MKNIEANFRLTPWLMATALSVVLAACGGGGQSTILGAGGIAPVVVLPPTVTVAVQTVALGRTEDRVIVAILLSAR